MSANGLERGERATVIRDGEELEVFDHVSVSTNHYVNSANGYETHEPDIVKGDMGVGPQPEAITERVAKLLQDEFDINAKDLGIKVVDPHADNVQLL